MNAQQAMKIVGDWVCNETCKRRYKREELKQLSEALKTLKKITDNQVAEEGEE